MISTVFHAGTERSRLGCLLYIGQIRDGAAYCPGMSEDVPINNTGPVVGRRGRARVSSMGGQVVYDTWRKRTPSAMTKPLVPVVRMTTFKIESNSYSPAISNHWLPLIRWLRTTVTMPVFV